MLSGMQRRSAEFRLSDFDRTAIHAAIEFANTKIESAEQVMGIFRPLARNRWRTVTDGALRDLREHDQRELRQWLNEITSQGNVAPKARAAIAGRIKTIDVTDAEVAFENGLLLPKLELDLTGVQACYSYAVALLVSRNNDRLARRLGRCAKCSKFFFDDRLGAGGPRRFCSPQHKNQLAVWKATHAGPWTLPDLP